MKRLGGGGYVKEVVNGKGGGGLEENCGFHQKSEKFRPILIQGGAEPTDTFHI